MDGLPSNLPLPPSIGSQAFVPAPNQTFAPPPAPTAQAQQIRQVAAVGRPSGDPEVQEARAEKHQLKQRLKTILPKSMTDGRIAIYKLEGRKGRTKTTPRPVISIPFQDLEKAMTDQGIGDTGEYVEERLRDKYGEKGRFLWTAEDNRGRTIPEVGEIEVDLNTSPEDDDVETEAAELDRLEREDREDREAREPRTPQFFQQQAPPPPAFDVAVHAKQVKEIVQEEKKSAESMVTVMMTMMQAQNQQNMMAMQQQLQQAETRRQEEDRRREREEAKEREERKMELERLRLEQERREKDEQRREDRDRERRQAEQQMQMQFFQSIMNKPDTMTPMLMKMVEGKGDRDGMKELFTLMGEASRHNMQAQGEATKHLLGAQAEAAKTMMSNVMGISQTMIQNMVEAQAEPTDDPMEKVARVFKMLAPALGAMTQNAQIAVTQQPQRVQQPPGQPAPPQQRAPVPPAEYVKGGLYTIMRLETGEIPPTKRFEALKWCAENLPKPMLDTIRSGVESEVMAQGAQGMDAAILGWVQDENHAGFLRGCIKDIQRMLLGAMTQVDAQASYDAHIAYQQAKLQTSQEGVIPQNVEPEQVAQPVASPANGKRRAPPPMNEPLKDVEQVSAEVKDAVQA